MLFAINAWCNSAIDVVIASDFWEVMSTRLFFLKDRARVHIFFTKTIQQVGFQAILILTLLGCTQGRSNEAMWWSCPMALCGCTTSEAPDGSLMATKTSSKVSKSDRNMLQSYSKWYTVYYYIYIYGYIMIYQYMHIEFYLSFPLIYTDGSEAALMVCPMRASRCRLAWNAQGRTLDSVEMLLGAAPVTVHVWLRPPKMGWMAET